ncbi:hypothetical protein K474DRAFT_581366 [Panus rudis PR-1116 ss-1]|nr:hypothetical protein K474DRAFT_581366 [Panus rudis PR-1116 ss-1]
MRKNLDNQRSRCETTRDYTDAALAPLKENVRHGTCNHTRRTSVCYFIESLSLTMVGPGLTNQALRPGSSVIAAEMRDRMRRWIITCLEHVKPLAARVYHTRRCCRTRNPTRYDVASVVTSLTPTDRKWSFDVGRSCPVRTSVVQVDEKFVPFRTLSYLKASAIGGSVLLCLACDDQPENQQSKLVQKP